LPSRRSTLLRRPGCQPWPIRGYQGAGIGILIPVKQPAGAGDLDINTRTRNAIQRSLRCLGERGFALLTGRWCFKSRRQRADRLRSRPPQSEASTMRLSASYTAHA